VRIGLNASINKNIASSSTIILDCLIHASLVMCVTRVQYAHNRPTCTHAGLFYNSSYLGWADGTGTIAMTSGYTARSHSMRPILLVRQHKTHKLSRLGYVTFDPTHHPHVTRKSPVRRLCNWSSRSSGGAERQRTAGSDSGDDDWCVSESPGGDTVALLPPVICDVNQSGEFTSAHHRIRPIPIRLHCTERAQWNE